MPDDFIGPVADWADLLKQAPENAKSTNAREYLERWNAFQKQAWSPSALTSEAISMMHERRTIWLDDAVDLMAFGLNACPLDRIELAARRSQASRALFEAARLGQVSFYGAYGPDEEEAISPRHFDIDRRLGGEIRSIEMDPSSASDRLFNEFSNGDRKKWFDVRIAEAGKFVQWLLDAVSAQLPVREIYRKNYDDLYRDHIKGRRTSRADDEKWGMDVGIGREAARDIRRRLAPPDWQEAKRPSKKK